MSEKPKLEGAGGYCPACNRFVPRFRTGGVQRRRPRARCPECGALERHRLLALVLDGLAPMLQEHGRVLDIAPSRYVSDRVQRIGPSLYVRLDLDPAADQRDIDVQASMTELPFAADSFDLVVCFHVLEHVPEDRIAMRELARVLRPGGLALVQVPPPRDRATDEDPLATEDERVQRFGQADHVRWYGTDFEERLTGAGLRGVRLHAERLVGAQLAHLMSLEDDDIIWVLRSVLDDAEPEILFDGGHRLGALEDLGRVAHEQYALRKKMQRQRDQARRAARTERRRYERIRYHPVVDTLATASRPLRRTRRWFIAQASNEGLRQQPLRGAAGVVLGPPLRRVHYLRARAAERLGWHDRALGAYETATRSVDRPTWLFRKGYLYERTGRPSRAGEVYRRALLGGVPDEAQRVLAEAEQIVVASRPREDDKFVQRTRLLRVDAALTELTSGSFISEDALALHARVADRLSDWPESVRRWERLHACFPDTPNHDRLGLAIARRKAGDVTGATEAMERLPAAARDRKKAQAERAELERLTLAFRADQQLDEHFKDAGHGSDAVVRQALRMQQAPEQHHGPLMELISRLKRLRHEGPRTPGRVSVEQPLGEALSQLDELTPLNVTLVTGFGWSGSGAVAAFLRDVPGVTEPFPPPELPWFREKFGNVAVQTVIDAGVRGTWPTAMADFLLTSVLGLGLTGVSGDGFAQAKRKGVYPRLTANDQDVDALLVECHQLIDHVDVLDPDDGRASEALTVLLRAFLESLLRLGGAQGAVLLDNPLRPDALHLVRLLPPTQVVAVFRDPRDQFVSLAVEQPSARKPPTVETFVDTCLRLRSGFEDAAAAQPDLLVHRVQFEEFVRSSHRRRELASQLGLSVPHQAPEGEHFRPEVSSQNVGIHRVYGREHDILRIEEALPSLLVTDL